VCVYLPTKLVSVASVSFIVALWCCQRWPGNMIFAFFCHMYFYRICVLYRLRRRAQHKMRGEESVPGMEDESPNGREEDECEANRVFFAVVWQHKTHIHIYVNTDLCVYGTKKTFSSSAATAKISLEILKARWAAKKNRIWYSKANQLTASNQMKWNYLNAAVCVLVWEFLSVWLCVLVYVCVRARE